MTDTLRAWHDKNDDIAPIKEQKNSVMNKPLKIKHLIYLVVFILLAFAVTGYFTKDKGYKAFNKYLDNKIEQKQQKRDSISKLREVQNQTTKKIKAEKEAIHNKYVDNETSYYNTTDTISSNTEYNRATFDSIEMQEIR